MLFTLICLYIGDTVLLPVNRVRMVIIKMLDSLCHNFGFGTVLDRQQEQAIVCIKRELIHWINS